MKALRSELAQRLLADPEARVQMRHALIATTSSGNGTAPAPRVTIRENGRDVSYQLVVVPKAA